MGLSEPLKNFPVSFYHSLSHYWIENVISIKFQISEQNTNTLSASMRINESDVHNEFELNCQKRSLRREFHQKYNIQFTNQIFYGDRQTKFQYKILANQFKENVLKPTQFKILLKRFRKHFCKNV